MLLGGGSSCQQCGCVSCTTCTRTCTEPHSGTAFAVVYTRQRSFSTDENLTDGYLTALGDYPFGSSPTGMPGTGPWTQQVSGTFILGGSSQSNRFPCSVRASFWRTTNVLQGPGGGGTPSTALTENIITVSVSYGAVVVQTGQVVTPENSPYTLSSIVPLVSATTDPRTSDGTVVVSAKCDNVETMFSIRASISWSVSNRQHRIFGIVRECYEQSSPCSCPSPDSYNDVLYVEVSGFTDPYSLGIPLSEVNGTYVAERFPNQCDYWLFGFGVIRTYTGTAGGVDVTSLARWTTQYGTGVLRVYQLEDNMLELANTGASYRCGNGTMGTVTTDISFWAVVDGDVQADPNAGTITLRVFK